LTSTLDLSEMIAKVKRVLRADDVAVIGTDRGDIRRVAVVGGSGGELIGEASERGADLLVTGEVGHHRALEAQTLGLSVIDAGHYRTERAAMRIFSERLAGVLGRQGWEMAVTFYTAETNPIRRA
jgi:putative NIF3 family GTP cyclohydrolase 1 type 2